MQRERARERIERARRQWELEHAEMGGAGGTGGLITIFNAFCFRDCNTQLFRHQNIGHKERSAHEISKKTLVVN